MAAAAHTKEKQRQFDIGAEEMWSPFLEEVNDLMIEEKQARHENDHVKVSEICLRIVSTLASLIIWLIAQARICKQRAWKIERVPPHP